MKKRKSKSWAMAYCGMAAALCVALMLLGTIIPHCHVHRACGGQLSHRNGVHGVRHHHGMDGVCCRQPAGAALCAG